MNIIDEKEETFYNMEMEFSKKEEKMMLGHYKTCCPKIEKKRLKIEWSVVDILKKNNN